MAGYRRAYAGTVAIHEVEDAGGHARRIENLGEHDSVERGDLAGLEHHRTTCGERRGHLYRDLVNRPVPRRDKAAYADRFAQDVGRSDLLFEIVFAQRLERCLEVLWTAVRLRATGETPGGPHLVHDRFGHVVVTVLELDEDRLE